MGKARHGADILIGIAFMMAVWKLGSLAVGKAIILPAPERVVLELGVLLASPGFLYALGATFLRGLAAFAISLLAGSIVGIASALSRRFRSFFLPILTVVRATPVLAVILLALIWFPSDAVPVYSAFIMAFPVVAADIMEGVRSTPRELVEMASLFRVSRLDTIRFVYVPQSIPAFLAAARSAIGLSWKVVVAGEVLSQPRFAIGTGMQNARIQLETTEVFAWAIAGIALCALSDALFGNLAGRISWRKP